MMHWKWTGDTRVEVLAFLSTSSAHFFLTSLFIYLIFFPLSSSSFFGRPRKEVKKKAQPHLFPPLNLPLPLVSPPSSNLPPPTGGNARRGTGEDAIGEIGIGGVAAGKKLPNLFSSSFGCCSNDAPLAPQQEEEEGALGRRKRRVGGSRGHR